MMKKIAQSKWYFLICALLLFISCKKDADVLPKELYAYVAPGNTAYNVLSGGNITLVGSTILAATDPGFPVVLSRSYEQDVEISAIIDTSYIKIYDSLYPSSSPSLSPPQGSFTLTNNGKTVIKAGELYSTDSITAALTDPSNIPTGTNTFIVPVVLQMAGKGVQVSTTRQVMYMPVTVISVAKGIVSLSGTSSTSVTIQNTKGQFTGPGTVYLKGTLNSVLTTDQQVSVKENLSLVSSYNLENSTDFLPFPSEAFQIVKNEVTIPAGKTSSTDDIEIKLPDASKFEIEKNYLLPVELVNNNNTSSAPVDASKKIVYVQLRVVKNNVDPANTPPVGTPVSTTGWKATGSSQYASDYSYHYAIDGDAETAWVSNGQGLPEWFQVDMGSSLTIKGFIITPLIFGSPFGSIEKAEVLSSNDGINWQLQGAFVGNPPFTQQNITFTDSVTARYFKLNILKTNNTFATISELKAFE